MLHLKFVTYQLYFHKRCYFSTLLHINDEVFNFVTEPIESGLLWGLECHWVKGVIESGQPSSQGVWESSLSASQVCLWASMSVSDWLDDGTTGGLLPSTSVTAQACYALPATSPLPSDDWLNPQESRVDQCPTPLHSPHCDKFNLT